MTGNVSPARVNAELLELVEESVTLPPLAVTLPFWLWVVPIVTLPKLMEPGVTPSVPLAVVPLPVRETVTEGSDALEVSVSAAVLVPEVAGEKVTERFALAPEDKLYGRDNPLTLYPLPATFVAEIVRLAVPVFETVRDCVWLLPTATLPRFMLEGAVR